MGGGLALPDRSSADPFVERPAAHYRELALALVDGIATLAQVDYRAVGLEGFGNPEGFLRRQVDRWLGQLATYGQIEGYHRDLSALDYVVDWLRANTPNDHSVGIIHGDYGFANVLFRPKRQPRIAAIIDWELATIGDPLLDLGWLLYGFRGRDDAFAPAGYFDADRFPWREELVERYAASAGRPVDNIVYYMVLAQFKVAILLERHHARAQACGNRAGQDHFGNRVLLLLRTAAEMARAHG